ncbi:MAG: quinate 5-dehydrogenase [Armatimonadota bacterium]|nr:quinate 5-dehydrogenase [Armatimonadota bacterium]
MKHVVSVSLGSSKRDKRSEVVIAGETFLIERIGTDGDLGRFQQMFAELDGKVDALGIGGADLYIWVGNRRYTFRSIQRLVSVATKTPVVDGSGLKNTLEREALRWIQEHGVVDFSRSTVLLVAAVDRFGMAQELAQLARRVIYGDLVFAIGLPIPIRSYRTVEVLGRLVLPIITRLPFQWFYPTGEKQEKRTPRAERLFHEADVIAGDWHYIRRYMPDRIPNKTVITNTVRKADIEFLRAAGAARVITTTPIIEGESFATNVMEGVIVALTGRRPETLTPDDYRTALCQLHWSPSVIELRV